MIRALPLILLTFLAAFSTGCGMHGRGDAESFADSGELAARAPAAAAFDSLFRSDQAVLSNEDIGRIFEQKVTPPAKVRLAVLRLGNPYPYRYYAPELAALERTAVNDVLARFRGSPRVAHAMVMPSMLTPPQMTIPYMREAAARLQADTLLVYRTSTQTYGRSRAFASDETRAYCTVEGILLDTRSGIVTSTAVATEQFSARRKSKDLTFGETMQRAEQEAISRALLKVAADLVAYLDSAPLPGADGGSRTAPSDPRATLPSLSLPAPRPRRSAAAAGLVTRSREARVIQSRHGHGRTEAGGRRVRAGGRPAPVA